MTFTRRLPWLDPERVMSLVSGHERCFWLDGAASSTWTRRYSYLGWLHHDDLSLTYDARKGTVHAHQEGRQHVVGTDIFAVLAESLELGARPVVGNTTGFTGGWVGYLGYACREDLPARVGAAEPDACMLRVRRFLAFDHTTQTAYAVSDETDPTAWFSEAETIMVRAGTGAVPEPFTAPTTRLPYHVGWSRARYRQAYEQVQKHLRDGNSYELNLTYRIAIPSRVAPFTVYRHLRQVNPAPYAAFLRHGDTALLSSSPERFLRVDGDRTIETRPIKGTTQRHAHAPEDRHLRELLAQDAKYRAENLIVVDLLRNDLSTVCVPGTVHVPELMTVESYPSVHQLVSTVRGQLRGDVSALDAARSVFPGGSMTGAPKRRTMELIAATEDTPRGAYSGALGWLGTNGQLDLGIVIRTLVAHRSGYTLGTGGAVTVRSDWASEYAETQWKASRLLSACAGATLKSLPAAARLTD